MATAYQNLSQYDFEKVPDASGMKIGIVVSEWNANITEALLKGACDTLERHGAKKENIYVSRVPGSFELVFGAKKMARTPSFNATMAGAPSLNAIIVLGCVVRGDTPHFDYVCTGVTQGIVELNLQYDIPVIFGLLTTDNMQQALDRAGGKYGNKGAEAAVAAIKMFAHSRSRWY
jgi:6,7-dimethyl-8-ribityllumazine synthase